MIYFQMDSVDPNRQKQNIFGYILLYPAHLVSTAKHRLFFLCSVVNTLLRTHLLLFYVLKYQLFN